MTRRRFASAATVVFGAAALTLLPVVAAGPATAASSAPLGFLGVAAADGVRVGVVDATFLVVTNVVDAGGPSAQALVDALGDSTAYAAYPYPGDLVLTAHGLSQGAAPDYPLIAQSSNPTTPSASVSEGPYALQATSGDNASAAAAQAVADGGAAVAGHTSSTASATHDVGSATVIAQSETTLEGLSFGGGVFSIGRFHSYVHVTSRPGHAPVRISDTEVGDVTVAGQQVGLTDHGLVLAGTTVPLPPDSTASAALSAAGVSVHYLSGYASGPTAVAPGVAVSVVQDVPGIGLTSVTYTLGQVSATAWVGVAAPTGQVGSPLGTFTQPAPTGSAGGGARPTAGPAPVSVAAPAVAAVAPNTVPPVALAAAPRLGNRYREVGLSTGPSSVSLYAVVALGAIVMAAAAQLFRVLAVRLAWG